MRQKRKTQIINGIEYQIVENNEETIKKFIHHLELQPIINETRKNQGLCRNP